MVCHWFHCCYLFFGVYASKVVCSYACFYFFHCVHLKHFGCIFVSCDMVEYLSTWCGNILLITGYLHSDVTVWCFLHFWNHMGLHLWCVRSYFPNNSFLANFPFSWCNYWVFAWLELLISFFAGCACWISPGYVSTIGTLICSTLVNGFDWGEFFIWFISWFKCWIFSWYDPLTGTLGGTAGGGWFSEYFR